MATKIRTRNAVANIPEAYPQLTNGYEEMMVTISGSFATASSIGTESAMYPGEKLQTQGSVGEQFGWWSERLDADVTISGTITFNIWRTHSASFLAWMRARLLKVTASGNVETLICQADAPQTTGSNSVLNFTGTPTSTTVAAGERLILRVSWYPITPGVWGSTTPLIFYGGSSAGSLGDTYVSLTEAVTFQPNVTTLYMRRTTAAGIGNFLDALPVVGVSALTTGVVNTAASGTEIQWTRTAGGTLLEWITPRMKHPGWRMTATGMIASGFAFASESNLAANCGLRMKLFKRAPNGVETAFYTISSGTPTELGTTRASQALFGGSVDAIIPMYEDDRMVARCYIIPVGGTMAAGNTCTIAYDGPNGSGFDGTISMHMVSFPFLKAESDPAGPGRESGLMMGGVGN